MKTYEKVLWDDCTTDCLLDYTYNHYNRYTKCNYKMITIDLSKHQFNK